MDTNFTEGSSTEGTIGSAPYDRGGEEESQRKQYSEVLAMTVAKIMAENSMSHYLQTVALLLVVMRSKEDRLNNLESASCNIPVASLIAAAFEKSDSGSKGGGGGGRHKKSSSSGGFSKGSDSNLNTPFHTPQDTPQDKEFMREEQEGEDSSLLGGNEGEGDLNNPSHPPRKPSLCNIPNPFYKYLMPMEEERHLYGMNTPQPYASSSSSKSVALSISDTQSRFDSEIPGDDDNDHDNDNDEEDEDEDDEENDHDQDQDHHDNDGEITDDAITHSALGHHEQPFSDAGSTVGSTIGSTLAELGTETASITGTDRDRFEEVRV